MPKDEDLAVHPGKKKEMSIKDNHQALWPPFTRGISKGDNTSCAELYSFRKAGWVGAEWKTASVE